MLLVERGLSESRTKAQAVIMSGEVYVDGQKADKPGASYDLEAKIEVRGSVCPYVSRGGLKLEKALRDSAWIPRAMFAATPAPPPAALRLPAAAGRQEGLCH